MSQQKPEQMHQTVLVKNEFALRMWETWEAPSLILMLDRDERAILRKAFDIHWEDLDVHMDLVQECFGTGIAYNQRPRRDRPFKVVYALNMVPEGIDVKVSVVALKDVENPLLDENGFARKVTYGRTFPLDRVTELFHKANSMAKAMYMFRLAQRAQLTGNTEVFNGLGNALDFAYDKLSGSTQDSGLTATVQEVTGSKGDKKGGNKGTKRGATKIPVISTETPDDRTASTAQALAAAATGIDPGEGVPEETDETSFAEVVTPVPVASASPTSTAPKAIKKVKPKAIKLGTPEAAAELAKVATSTSSDGSNGQTS